jgi:hypothetical protein
MCDVKLHKLLFGNTFAVLRFSKQFKKYVGRCAKVTLFLTLCWLDRPLIKYLPVITLWMFNPVTYCYLQFDTADFAPEPQTACRMSSSSSLHDISQDNTLCEAEQHTIYKCTQCQHTLYTVSQGTTFSLPTRNSFFKFVFSESPRESAWLVTFRPPWCY